VTAHTVERYKERFGIRERRRDPLPVASGIALFMLLPRASRLEMTPSSSSRGVPVENGLVERDQAQYPAVRV